jgi:hypothetical protein
MKITQKQKISSIITTLITGGSLFLSSFAFALDCSNLANKAANPNTPDSILYLVCPIIRLINVGFVVLGAVVVIMVVYGGIKASLAFGDPKALQGAKMTWTWAAIGAGVVLLSVVIIPIILKLFGIDLTIDSVLQGLESSFSSFWNTATK